MVILVRLFGKIKDLLAKNRYFRLYINDYEIRLTLTLLFGLLLNLTYVAFNAVSGILYRSAWLITVAAYHTMLVAIHYIILRVGSAGDLRAERRASVLGGILLLAVDIAAGAMIFYTLRVGRAPSYSSVVVITLAAFAVYNLITTALALSRKRESERPTYRAAHTVRIVAAMMSAFNLITATLPSLPLDSRAVVALHFVFGALISLTVLVLTLVMLSASIKYY